MYFKPVDSFIVNSVKLFEVNPSQSVFSLSYKLPENCSNPTVTVKTSNPHLSANHKFRTNKVKDVSRLLSALGPRGVTVNIGKVEKKVKKPSSTKQYQGKFNKKVQTRDVVGLSTLMANTEVKQYVPVVTIAAYSETFSKSKKNKNKNKKKR